MCYSAAYWANIRSIFYAASWSDYEDLFPDRAINDDIRRSMPEKEIRMQQILQSEAHRRCGPSSVVCLTVLATDSSSSCHL